ncbi:MAG: hypothetical protein NT157_05850 [Candidatus Micrarchaeota archaeon]|nr:hypothetical protein [Candidatus Micrarchaeota archaeon]
MYDRPKKRFTVKFSEEAYSEFELLSKKVADEKSKGSTKSDHEKLLRSINAKIELLKLNPQAGVQIPRRLIPAKYIVEYGANNLWKLNLFSGWRMIYTLHANEVEVISFVLDLINHEQYEKIFRYKKK